MNVKNNYNHVVNTNTRKLHTVYKSILVGILAGIISVFYRFVLGKAEHISGSLYEFLRSNILYVPVGFIILAVVGLGIGILVQRYPMISGSGIPQVKGQLIGAVKNRWLSTMVMKFIGGAIALLAGLSVGREGPSIQLGASIAQGAGEKIATTRTERKILISSGASAGLAAAFNSPLAGTMFALEEIFKYFSPIVLLSTTSAAVMADFISKTVFGIQPVFRFQSTTSIPLQGYWILIPIGILLGIAGSFYNWTLISAQKIYRVVFHRRPYLKLIVPFVTAGILGIYLPMVLGGGHYIIEELNINKSLQWLILILIVKFVFSILSFSSGAPGGIFFPLLVLGATMGAIFGNIAVNYLGFSEELYFNFITIAMVGMFSSIVRAPITGIILLTEMTGSFHHLLTLAFVAIISYITADLLKSKPIYESLLDNLLMNSKEEPTNRDHVRRITIENVVQFGSPCENKLVKEIPFPIECLLIAIRREDKEIIPKGDVRIQVGDYITVITSVKEEYEVRKKLEELTSSLDG